VSVSGKVPAPRLGAYCNLQNALGRGLTLREDASGNLDTWTGCQVDRQVGGQLNANVGSQLKVAKWDAKEGVAKPPNRCAPHSHRIVCEAFSPLRLVTRSLRRGWRLGFAMSALRPRWPRVWSGMSRMSAQSL
jgi:hypothetical protein